MQCNYNSFIQIINFHGLFRNALRCRKTGACRILVPLRYAEMISFSERLVPLRSRELGSFENGNGSNLAGQWGTLSAFCSKLIFKLQKNNVTEEIANSLINNRFIDLHHTTEVYLKIKTHLYEMIFTEKKGKKKKSNIESAQ